MSEPQAGSGDDEKGHEPAREIGEHEIPAKGLEGEFVEYETPTGGLAEIGGAALQRENTRRLIAYALLGLLGLVTLSACIGWLWRGEDLTYMQSFGVIISPIVALVGTMLGFYFSSEK